MVNSVVTDLTHLAWVVDEELDILIILPFSLSFESLNPTPQRLGRRPYDGWRLAKKTKKLNTKIKRMTSIDVYTFRSTRV